MPQVKLIIVDECNCVIPPQTDNPPPVPPQPPKFVVSWRTEQLSKPKHLEIKYHLKRPPKPVKSHKLIKIDDGIMFRCTNLALSHIRKLRENRKAYCRLKGKIYVKRMNKYIGQSWRSIYNFYKKATVEKQKKDAAKAKKTKTPPTIQPKIDFQKIIEEATGRLAQPKKDHYRTNAPKRQWKPLDQLLYSVDRLSPPKEYEIITPKDPTKVNPVCLTYEPTEIVTKLFQTVPERYKFVREKPYIPGGVVKAALKAKMTTRLEELSKPQIKEQSKDDDDNGGGWTMNPWALKYKATQRIIDLAKPIERD